MKDEFDPTKEIIVLDVKRDGYKMYVVLEQLKKEQREGKITRDEARAIYVKTIQGDLR